MISGSRIRRITRRMPAGGSLNCSVRWSGPTGWPRSGSGAPNRRDQNKSSGLPTVAAAQRRRKETVSITSRTTETTLANRAPPDNETTLAINSGVNPLSATWVA